MTEVGRFIIFSLFSLLQDVGYTEEERNLIRRHVDDQDVASGDNPFHGEFMEIIDSTVSLWR